MSVFDTHTGTQPAAPVARPRRRLLLLIGAIVLVVVAVGGFAVYRLTADPADSVNRAKAGDCVAPDADAGEPPYRLVACTDPAAEYRVLSIIGRTADGPVCRDVAGASRLFTTSRSFVCLGERDVDQATAVNVAAEGDCLFIQVEPPSRADPLRLDCAEERANFKVLKRLNGVSKLAVSEACAEVANAVRTYSWDWTSNDGYGASRLTVEVVLCLGYKTPPPSRPPVGNPGPGNRCQYLTAAEMSAAVSGVMGRTYPVPKAEEAQYECLYRFDDKYETVRTYLRAGAGEYRPGTASQRLTVDGLDAYYGPGEGNRVLTVLMPVGHFSVVVWLKGADDNRAKKIATEVFRIARPRLG